MPNKKAGRVRKANDALFGQVPQDDVFPHEVAAESADSQKGTANTNPLTNPLTSKVPHTTPSASSLPNTSSATQETSTGQVDTTSLVKEPTAFEKKLGVTLPSRESLLDFAEFARGQNLTPEVQRLAERIRKMGQSESQPAERTDTQIISEYKSIIGGIKNMSKQYNAAKEKNTNLFEFKNPQKLVDAAKLACTIMHVNLDQKHPITKTRQLQVILPSEDICVWIEQLFRDQHKLSSHYKGVCRFMGDDIYWVMVSDAYVCPTDFVDRLSVDLISFIHDTHASIAAGREVDEKEIVLLELAEKAAVGILVDAKRKSEGRAMRIGRLEHWTIDKIKPSNKATLVEEMERFSVDVPGQFSQLSGNRLEVVKDAVEKFDGGMLVAAADQKRTKKKK